MRCMTVIHELSAPTGEPPGALVVDHLASCPSCARWAEQNARLDRLWEATRPPELSTAAWDRLWANVSESLDRPRVATPLAPAPALVVSRPWRRSAAVAFVLAQAAAILVCFGLAWRHSPTGRQPQPMTVATRVAPAEVGDSAAASPSTAEAQLSELVVDVSTDQTVLISLDDRTVRDLPTNESPYSLSLFSLPMFNAGILGAGLSFVCGGFL
jgi:hypothetical protein